MTEDASISQDPVDRLIRGLVLGVRTSEAGDAAVLGRHVSLANFPSESLAKHLARRQLERQFAPTVTASGYLAVLRRASSDSASGIVVYSARGGAIVALIARTQRILAPLELGFAAQPNLLVVYSADRGRIVTGYQFSLMERVRIPDDALWLRRPLS